MNKNKVPGLITILIATLITVVAWIGFSIYRAFANKPTPNVSQAVLQPLTPSLDKNIIDKIQGRLYFDESVIPEPSIGPTETQGPAQTPVPEISPTPVATGSAVPSATTLTPTP